MGVVFQPGQTLSRGDLDIFLTNSVGNATNAFSITYALYYVDPATQVEVLIGPSARIPVNPAVGEYYASLMVPVSAQPGDYRIRWTFQETSATPSQQVVQEFAIVSTTTDTGTSGGTATLSQCQSELVKKLRFMLRDNNPDKNYHFRPPEGEGTVGCYNQVFGYIWTDEELLEFLKMALDKWNMQPPETEELCDLDAICTRKPAWKAALLWGAVVHAAMALAFNWVADEFDYSIGGISLNINKSAGYMDLKRNAEEQWDKLTEAKSRTTKFMRGLKQPRFGIGVRSAFGPHVGRGVLSPRNFVVFVLGIGYPLWQEMLNHASHLPTLFA
jgi:hypothetical protein